MSSAPIINKTLEFSDLRSPQIQPTVASLHRWLWNWLLRGERLAVNGHVKRRLYIRKHKMWEYARGLALTGASAPVRRTKNSMTVLEVGGAMTAPEFYLASQGDRVMCLDIDEKLTAQTNGTARRRGLHVDARTTNLVDEDPSSEDLGVEGGFDRAYSFCVIEHIPPPGQQTAARRIAGLLKPGGQMCLTFDYGEHAPTEAPLKDTAQVQEICHAVGLPLMVNDSFVDTGTRYRLDRKYPDHPYTFGSLFFHRPQ